MRSRWLTGLGLCWCVGVGCAQGSSFTGGLSGGTTGSNGSAQGGGSTQATSSGSGSQGNGGAPGTASSSSTASGAGGSPGVTTSSGAGGSPASTTSSGAGGSPTSTSSSSSTTSSGTTGATENQACTVTTDCAGGLACTTAFDKGGQQCEKTCTKTSQCTSPGGSCTNLTTGNPGTVCTTSCNPMTNAGCLATEACRLFEVGNNPTEVYTYCGGIGTKGQGATCSVNSTCKAGFECVNTGFGSDCEEICDPNNDTCPGAYSCTDFGVPLGSSAIGSCE